MLITGELDQFAAGEEIERRRVLGFSGPSLEHRRIPIKEIEHRTFEIEHLAGYSDI